MKESNNELITRARRACEAAKKFLARKSELQADLAAQIANKNYSLEPRACSSYGAAFAGVSLAREVEPLLQRELQDLRQAVGARSINESSNLESRHAEIDRLIAAAAAAMLPRELEGAAISVEQTPLHRAEVAARFHSPVIAGSPLPPDSPIDTLVRSIEEMLPRLEKVDAELRRCATVVERFQKKAA